MELFTSGIGAWCVKTEYSDDLMNQVVSIKPIYSACTSVYNDPDAMEYNDAEYCFVTQRISKSKFEQEYPGKAFNSIDVQNQPNQIINQGERRGQDSIKIADYWVKEYCIKTIVQLSNGQIIELNEETNKIIDELQQNNITIKKTRKAKTHKIVHYKISGSEILDGPNEWSGKYIPIVVVYGYPIVIDGKYYYHGMARFSRDAQQLYNYTVGAIADTSALSPKDPIFITADQVEGYEKDYETFNSRNSPFLFYNDVEGGKVPFKLGPPSLQQALIYQLQNYSLDIESTIGRYSANLGMPQGDNKSGVAIFNESKKGEESTFLLTDEMDEALQCTGKILVDLIPKIYDTERQVRILNPDGSDKIVTINQLVIDSQTGEHVLINDLSVGSYDVIVSSGPNYDSKRVEALNFLSRLSESSPLFAQVSADLLAKNVDFPFSEELERRVRKVMITQGLITDLTEEEKQELAQTQQTNPIEEIQLIEKQLQNELTASKVQKEQSEVAKNQAEVDHIRAKTNSELTDSEKTQVDILEKINQLGTQMAQVMALMSQQTQQTKQMNLDIMQAQMVPNVMPQQEIIPPNEIPLEVPMEAPLEAPQEPISQEIPIPPNNELI